MALPSGNSAPFRDSLQGHRRITRHCALNIITFLIIIAGFSTSMILMYRNLSSRMIQLTSASVEVSDLDLDPSDQGWVDDDMIGKHNSSSQDTTTTTLQTNMTVITEKILSVQEQVEIQQQEIKNLHALIDTYINETVTRLNNTVEEVQQSLLQQVQDVNHNVGVQSSLMAYQFAGTFAILASLISIWHTSSHMRNLIEPVVQRKIVAILWMIPIYSVSSWLSLVFVQAEGYLIFIKDLYESYIVYTFFSFLMCVLGRGDRNAVVDLLAKHVDHLKPPIHFKFWTRRPVFDDAKHKASLILDQCQFFAMQFVMVRPITSMAMLVSDAIVESRWDWRYPQFYIMWTVNLSVFFAFTGLVKFYHAVREDLKWCHPFSKFLCIKGVVFMTFWQNVMISFLAHAVFFKNKDDNSVGSASTYDEHDATEWAKQAQSFLTCLEMFLFAIVHCFVFPVEEWEEGYREKMEQRHKIKLGDNLALRDFFKDVKLVMRNNKKKKMRKKQAQGLYSSELNISNDSDNESWSGRRFGDDDSVVSEEDVDWKQGWSRIEQYISEVDSKGELQSNSDSNSTDADERQTEKKDVDDNVERKREASLSERTTVPTTRDAVHNSSMNSIELV